MDRRGVRHAKGTSSLRGVVVPKREVAIRLGGRRSVSGPGGTSGVPTRGEKTELGDTGRNEKKERKKATFQSGKNWVEQDQRKKMPSRSKKNVG